MDLVEPGFDFCFNFVDYGSSDALNIMASIYDVSSGTAVFVTDVIMESVGLGLYSGNFEGDEGKTYLIISVVYTSNTFVTPMPNRAPNARCFQVIDTELVFCAFAFAAFNQLESLVVKNTIYDLTTETPVFVEMNTMAHVQNGVYFGSFIGETDHTYQAFYAVYNGVNPEPFYAPGCDSFQCFEFGGINVVFELRAATLIGQDMNSLLLGQELNATLVEANLETVVTPQELDAILGGHDLNANLNGGCT